MGFLLVLALLSCTASFVHSASNKTTQGACSPQPCSTICGATTPYDECTQYCTGGGCDTLVCTSSIVNCTQVCTGGGCKLLECNSKRCEQICTGGDCNMTCLSNTDECMNAISIAPQGDALSGAKQTNAYNSALAEVAQ